MCRLSTPLNGAFDDSELHDMRSVGDSHMDREPGAERRRNAADPTRQQIFVPGSGWVDAAEGMHGCRWLLQLTGWPTNHLACNPPDLSQWSSGCRCIMSAAVSTALVAEVAKPRRQHASAAR